MYLENDGKKKCVKKKSLYNKCCYMCDFNVAKRNREKKNIIQPTPDFFFFFFLSIQFQFERFHFDFYRSGIAYSSFFCLSFSRGSSFYVIEMIFI